MGAVNCNLLLGDEINRTSAKTQSALLEVMEEMAVTVDLSLIHILQAVCVSFHEAEHRLSYPYRREGPELG